MNLIRFSMETQSSLLCPSYSCKPGAQLIGIINSEGLVDYISTKITIDENFVDEANKGREPEQRFRFAGKCAKSGCNQWDKQGSQCGLIDNIIDLINHVESIELKPCPIRSNCRWYAQRKGLACAQCNEVVRNIEMSILELES